jgi:hypothetical protein
MNETLRKLVRLKLITDSSLAIKNGDLINEGSNASTVSTWTERISKLLILVKQL